jgi:tetratricopeptide (TPR) repeat protein
MAKKNVNVEDQNLENVQEALNTTTMWIEKNRKKLLIALSAVVVVVLAVLGYMQFVVKPTVENINNDNYLATLYFMQGDFEKALNGDSVDCVGFKQVADEYGRYQGGKLAALYTGICYSNMEQYENATEYLARFEAGDVNIEPAALQFLGDTYVRLGDYDKAIQSFEKAAKSENDVIAPMSLKKAGIVYLELKDNASALKAFEAIKNDYPTSDEAKDIEKFISLAQ